MAQEEKNRTLQGKTIVFRCKISEIMKQEGLVSSYTLRRYKPKKRQCNESETENLLQQNFKGHARKSVIVSDLTYVRVGAHWNYICFLIDLYNRELIGHSVERNKTAQLVRQAFSKV